MPEAFESNVGTSYPTHAPAWAERFGEDDFGIFAGFRVEGVGFVFRWIPPGRFSMGSPNEEAGRWDDEGPVHEVVITRGFWMGETPVTQDQWRAVVETMGRDTSLKPPNPKPSHFQGPGTLPVEHVSWKDCVSFSGLLSFGMATAADDSPTFRLPTEAEWEYACRAGTTTALPTGGMMIRGEHDSPELDPIGWYGGNSGQELEVQNPFTDASDWKQRQYPGPNAGTHRVGLKAANRWGLHDMIGNVCEWCADWFGAYTEGSEIDPTGPASGSNRVFRGGSWILSARCCRSACRLGYVPGNRGRNLGFRLVLAPRSVL